MGTDDINNNSSTPKNDDVQCEFVHENVVAYVYKDLDNLDARNIDIHILGCSACRKLVDETRQNVKTLEIPDPEKHRVAAPRKIHRTDLRRQPVKRKSRSFAKASFLLPMFMAIFVLGLLLLLQRNIHVLLPDREGTETREFTRPQGAVVRINPDEFQGKTEKEKSRNPQLPESEVITPLPKHSSPLLNEDVDLRRSEPMSISDQRMFRGIVLINRGQLDKCFKFGKAEYPNLSGYLTVSFLIDQDGVVRETMIIDRSMASQKMELCILQEASGWKFRSPDGVKKDDVDRFQAAYRFVFK